MRRKILITGMSGLIGGVVRQKLEGQYELSALNRSAVEGVTTFQADLSDFEAIRPAFEGQDIVIHLAAKASNDYSWEELHAINNVGTYNVFEAARQAGVQRVIFASSGATTSGWEREEPYRALVEGRYDDAPATWPMITHQTPTRPGGIYGATKIWGEALGRHFADVHQLSVICLRIGFVNAEDRPLNPRQYSVWCSQRDVATMIALCVEASDTLRFDTFYVVSNNRWNYRDLAHARDVLGFEPQDNAETYR